MIHLYQYLFLFFRVFFCFGITKYFEVLINLFTGIFMAKRTILDFLFKSTLFYNTNETEFRHYLPIRQTPITTYIFEYDRYFIGRPEFRDPFFPSSSLFCVAIYAGHSLQVIPQYAMMFCKTLLFPESFYVQ